MFITDKEVKRVVALHFKERYKMEIDPKHMRWTYERIAGYEDEEMVSGLELGGDIVGKNS